MTEKPWKRLDNAAQIFPAATTDRMTLIFRLSVNLAKPVDPVRLQDAFHAVLPRFAPFRVRLKPGVFWHTLVDEPHLPPVYAESCSPCLPLRREHPLLLRVRWFGRRLAVEFSHVLTDGIGGLVFVKALVAEYLHRCGLEADDPDDVRRLRCEPDPAEASDDFRSMYDPAFPRLSQGSRAFQPRWPLLPQGQYAVTTGRIPVDAALTRAKERKASLTEYVAATLLAAFQDAFFRLPSSQQRHARPLRLVIPVNLRPVFGSKTLRNFFVIIPVEIDPRLGRYDFEEIVRKVHHQLQAEMDPKLLKKQVVRNLRGELNPLGRLVPLPVKNLILSAVYRSFERRQTASLSNVGRVDWPDGWGAAVRSVDFTPPPSPHCRLNAAMVSSRGVLSITLGSLSADSAVERAFFRRLRLDGLPVAIESNRSVLED